MKHEEKFDLEYYLAHEKGGMTSYRELNNTIKLFDFGDTYVKQIEPDYPDMVCTQMSFYQDTLRYQFSISLRGFALYTNTAASNAFGASTVTLDEADERRMIIE